MTRSVLLASMVSRDFFTTYSALVTVTVGVSVCTVTVTLFVVAPNFAEIVAVVLAATCWAAIGKVAVRVPGATVTLAGTVRTAGFALARVATVPSAAGPFSVMVPTAASPPNIPIRLAGAADIEAKVNGSTMVI